MEFDLYIQTPWITINKRLKNKQNHKRTVKKLKTKMNASTKLTKVNIF